MPRYVASLHGINAQDTIELQEVFLYTPRGSKPRYTPFESFDDPLSQYPLCVLGELGGIFNAYGKHLRDNTDWSSETSDEVADSFIYLLVFAMSLRHISNNNVLDFAGNNWDRQPQSINTYAELFATYNRLVGQILSLQESNNHTVENFGSILRALQDIGVKLTKRSWQEIMDTFHTHMLEEHLRARNYTPDLWFLGSGYVNFSLLLIWLRARIAEGKLQIPTDRIKTFERFAELQNA
ncbi:MAG TPA: hypothetical protein VGS08_04030 [Candidatus Saccharimonadales bacterium]|nr:hypothetical protein [Candidatus Saccharimonadales bacterium]